jgi:hypothetical protein
MGKLEGREGGRERERDRASERAREEEEDVRVGRAVGMGSGMGVEEEGDDEERTLAQYSTSYSSGGAVEPCPGLGVVCGPVWPSWPSGCGKLHFPGGRKRLDFRV